MSILKDNITIAKQPKALYVLFFVEIWERFSFYGIQALLVLYMIHELSFHDSTAYGVLGIYGALVYASSILGGYLSDNFLGTRRAITIGGFIITFGHITLALPWQDSLFYGLSLVIVGTGLFKPSIASLLGSFYQKNDTRRDSGFTYFYIGVNIGSFMAPLICGTVGETYGWDYGFGLAAIGMLLGLAIFYYNRELLKDKGLPSDVKSLDKPIISLFSLNHLIIFGCILSVFLFAFFIKNSNNMTGFIELISFSAFSYIIYIAFNSNTEEKKCILTALLLFIFTAIYFALYFQLSGSLTLFMAKNINRNVLGFTMPASWVRSIDPFFIFLLAPILAVIWKYLGKNNKEPNVVFKFALGFFATGIGFLLFVTGIKFANTSEMVNMVWLVAGIAFLTLGELNISPVGLSMVTKLSPKRLTGLMMGIFFLCIGLGNYLAQKIAIFFSGDKTLLLNQENISSLLVFEDTFSFLFKISLLAGFIILLLNPFVKGILKRHN